MLKNILMLSVPFIMLLLYSVVACFLGYGLFIALDGSLELRKLISKSTQILLILSIYPLARYLQHSAAELGFVNFTRFMKHIAGGMILGVISLLPILYLSYALDITLLNTAKVWTISSLLGNLAIALLLAFIISLLEEPMFRGILITAYIKRIGISTAILISSFYYAILHFIKTKTPINIEEAQLSDSFQLLGEALQNLFNPQHLGALWALLMVGIFLAVMRTHLKLSLAWCIGCHAAWVWQIKMAHKLVIVNPDSDLVFLVSPYDGVIGPMVAIWLSLLIGSYFIYVSYNSVSTHSY